jgi:hypothetical protein
MTVAFSQLVAPVFLRGLSNMAHILDQAAEHLHHLGLEPHVLLEARLAPDMYPLTRQVQLVSDFARNAVSRLSGIDAPHFEDNEASIPELRERLARTSEYIESVDSARIDGAEERDISFRVAGVTRTMQGQSYLLRSAIPNFYFHLTTAYAILRHNGVQLAKKDFIGLS